MSYGVIYIDNKAHFFTSTPHGQNWSKILDEVEHFLNENSETLNLSIDSFHFAKYTPKVSLAGH